MGNGVRRQLALLRVVEDGYDAFEYRLGDGREANPLDEDAAPLLGAESMQPLNSPLLVACREHCSTHIVCCHILEAGF